MKKGHRIAFVGCGAISRHWGEYVTGREDCEVIALVDINRANALKFAERYGFKCGIYSDVKKAIKNTDADLVFDLTFVTSHKDVVVKALQEGCDVFGEKPMAFTIQEADEMVDMSSRTGKEYFVMQNRRYTKGLRDLKELTASGLIGKPLMVCTDLFVEEDLNSIRNQMEYPMLQDNAVHAFDQVRFLTGSDPISVYCSSFNPETSKYNGDSGGVCTFEMTNGIVFNFRCLMGINGIHTSWESLWRVVGSSGSAVWDGLNQPYYETLHNGKHLKGSYEGKWNGRLQHEGCLDDMFDALEKGKKAPTCCEDNIRSMAMVFSSISSAEKGAKVDVVY